MKTLRVLTVPLITLVCILGAAPALAQWQWIDKDGRKVFSDRAPPPEVLEKNILKRPAGQQRPRQPAVESEGETAKAGSAAPAALPGGVPTLPTVDKELEAKKKQAADAEAAKRKAEEERITKAKIENCARAKQAKASFDSGVRIATTNTKGEREVMDDATRAAETRRIQSIIDSDCR